MLGALLALAVAELPPAFAAAGGPATLVVAVDGVRSARGRVHVELCPEPVFLGDCPLWAEAPATTGSTSVVFRNLPVGRYALQGYHDENANKSIDRGMFGVPKEGVGFSNDAPIGLGPPRFSRAAIELKPGDNATRFRLRYLFR